MNKKPTKLKVIEGNRSKRPLPKNEPKPRPDIPDIPKDIDTRAKKVWKELAPKLNKLGLLTETDGDMFAALCQQRSRLDYIHRQLKKRDNKTLIQEDDKGIQKASPYVVMEKQYYTIFRLYAAEFGLTPRGRTGLAVGSDRADEGAELIK